MKKLIVFTYCILISLSVFCKKNLSDFDFGKYTGKDFYGTHTEDSTANAFILKEYGYSRVDNETGNIKFTYHVRIKILNKEGLEHATFEIPVQKQGSREEIFTLLNASTFLYERGKLIETKLNKKHIFQENKYKYVDVHKFTMPDVQDGSIVEVEYSIESPFIFNYRPWYFQSDIPKLESLYKTSIPANYRYNVALKGYLKLDINEQSVDKECFGRGFKTDCAISYLGMKNIPAFKEEEYMLASSNYISAVEFELSEVHAFNGRIDKYTKTWDDVDLELKTDNSFGKQLKRGKEVFSSNLDPVLKDVSDPLERANIIYDYIKNYYKWNEYNGKYSESGIKKAYDQKTGNVGDINLSLIAALQGNGFNANPVLISTRQNGQAIELYPVLSQFNYVICHLKIDTTVYLLDASDPYLPFGTIPIKCINGKGRVMDFKESYWIDIHPEKNLSRQTSMNLKIDSSGNKGKVTIHFFEYEALGLRKTMSSYNSEAEYIEYVNSKLNNITITDYEIKNRQNVLEPVMITYHIEFDNFNIIGRDRFYFNPFVFDKWNKNPFISEERNFPVDFGAPMSQIFLLNIEYPDTYKIVDIPEKISLSLPNNRGRYTFNTQNMQNRLSIKTTFKISNIYTSDEYHHLKELFARIVQLNKSDIVFEKK